MDDILLRGLPKWPQMRVAGVPVAPDQALEIIRRTDSFFTHSSGGNNRNYAAKIREILGMPDIWSPTRNDNTYDLLLEWKNQWGAIDLEYISNSWVSTSYVGGPHGWVHPNGMISSNRNVGKWPSMEELALEWATVARIFPFLDLHVVFMDGEWCEDHITPVAGLKVKNGLVVACEPEECSYLEGVPEIDAKAELKQQVKHITKTVFDNDYRHETAITMDQIHAWKTQIFGESK